MQILHIPLGKESPRMNRQDSSYMQDLHTRSTGKDPFLVGVVYAKNAYLAENGCIRQLAKSFCMFAGFNPRRGKW